MHLVEEKIGVTAVDEEDELLLFFWRLTGGAVDELFEVDILLKIEVSKFPSGRLKK